MNDDTTQESEDTEFVPDHEAAFPDAAEMLKKLRQRLAHAEQERKEYLDGWQRAKADLINYKKEEQRRFEDLARYGAEGLLRELVDVLDNFDLALGAGAPPEVEKGIMLIRGQMENILRSHGAEPTEVQTGDSFDPALHEAIGEEESDAPAGAVARVLQKGYRLHGRVLRPARVKLSKSRSVL